MEVYVDDILIAGKSNEINTTKIKIKNKFEIREIGNVDFMIRIKFIKHKDVYLLNQKRYIKELLEKYNMTDRHYTIKKYETYGLQCIKNQKIDQTLYRGAFKSLLNIIVCTRPDILYAVNKAARKSKDPNMEDWMNVKKIFRYLKLTINYGLNYTRNDEIKLYVDADYVGDIETRKSTTGFIILIGNTPTSCVSKLQHCVSTSTAESEYYSLSVCFKHCIWYLNLFKELNYDIKYITINIDNKATIYNSKNQFTNPKTKHIDIRYHYIRELIKENKINFFFKYIKSDVFTKYLNNTLMVKFRNSLLFKIEDLKF